MVSLEILGEDVVVGPLAVLGKADIEFPNLDGKTIHILTAENPDGADQSLEANQAANDTLLVILAGRDLVVCPAVGHNVEGTHSEVSVAVTGLTDDGAVQVGRQFGQQAIFSWRPDSWDLIRCSDAATECREWGGVVINSSTRKASR